MQVSTRKVHLIYALFRLSARYLDDEDLGEGFGNLIFSNVMDGAPACISAMKLLEKEEFLIPVRCASHALALFVKHVAKNCFEQVLDKANTLITFIRGKSRVHSIVKEKSKLAIFRFVDTRFLTHVVACDRLLSMKATLIDLCKGAEYKEWLKDQDEKVKRENERIASIIKDTSDDFWDPMHFMVSVLQPACIALRIMDQSRIRVKDVISVWDGLEKSLIKEIMSEEFNNMPNALKKMIITQCKGPRSCTLSGF